MYRNKINTVVQLAIVFLSVPLTAGYSHAAIVRATSQPSQPAPVPVVGDSGPAVSRGDLNKTLQTTKRYLMSSGELVSSQHKRLEDMQADNMHDEAQVAIARDVLEKAIERNQELQVKVAFFESLKDLHLTSLLDQKEKLEQLVLDTGAEHVKAVQAVLTAEAAVAAATPPAAAEVEALKSARAEEAQLKHNLLVATAQYEGLNYLLGVSQSEDSVLARPLFNVEELDSQSRVFRSSLSEVAKKRYDRLSVDGQLRHALEAYRATLNEVGKAKLDQSETSAEYYLRAALEAGQP